MNEEDLNRVLKGWKNLELEQLKEAIKSQIPDEFVTRNWDRNAQDFAQKIRELAKP